MDVLQTVRTTLILAFRSFPLLMISFIGFLAIGLGNLGLFILFMGQAVLVPIATALAQYLSEKIPETSPPSYHIKSSQASQLVPLHPYTAPIQNVTPSYWLMQVSFLFFYILANAVSVYMLPVDSKLPAAYTDNRKSTAVTIMVTTFFWLGIIIWLRAMTHTEHLTGILVAISMGAGLGFGWYQFAAVCGARSADVFGIVQQILPATALETTPMTCVYAPKP